MTDENKPPKRARENLSDQKDLTKLCFSNNFGGKDVRLFEVSDDILNLISCGEKICIIGEDDGKDGAVLCTSDSTFSIKKVESSNSTFLVSGSESSEFTIYSKCNDYYELTASFPRIHRINDLLKPTIYRGANNDVEFPPNPDQLYKYLELRSRISASEKELNVALSELHVTEINGYCRILDQITLYETYKELIDTIIEEKWQIESIPNALMVGERAACSGLDPVFLHHALSTLGTCVNELWKLDSDEISKIVAHILFQERVCTKPNTLWPKEDFLFTWASRLPGTANPSLNLLLGIAVLEESISVDGGAYRYLPLKDLPKDAKERFQHLFTVRPSYSLEEITPYLEDLVGKPGLPKNTTELLLLHTRLVDGKYVRKL
mmetsp:Transcript_10093/g.10183  ORF Transcript_10093/g.10183 Transcript_10093/m.10183 type:complete len:378 (+) Transcript_10093:108-1241(+)|eukprot:CAMPEP_0182422348 /NCGR_PEP_ID=MMETSP1167-20130531/8008_1 /TAXON_ID=2988 /ORGANISM="Mallomonas Sp, Strain CCMP3275" /LENGTH=377 /DNA_ID=CAMNT_0024600331 /DNA_START=66 /DNA_END=1199 /DNA_ORIENTATION=-